MLLIGIFSYLTLRNIQQAEEDSDWVVHTRTVETTLQSVIGNAIDTVSGGRGFALTRQNSFLDVGLAAQRRLDRDVDTLRRLTADNANQQTRIDRLQTQIRASLESTLKIEASTQQTGNIPSDGEFVESKRNLDAVRATVAEMQDEEAKLLELRMAESQRTRRLNQITVWSSTLAGMGLLALFGILLRRAIGRGDLAAAQLRRLNADLELQSALSRRAEAEARRNELRFLAAAESSLDCLYLADAVRDANGEIEDFVFTYVNGNAGRLVTVPMEELIGGRMCELFPLNRKIGLFERYTQVVLTGQGFVGEFAIQEQTIKTGWLRVQTAQLGDGVAVTASDITVRKEQEEALRKSAQLLERTGRVAGIGGWEIDIVSREVTWSTETYRILGADPAYQPTLEEAYNLYSPEDRPLIIAAMEKAAAVGDGFDLELTVVRFGGRKISVRAVGMVEFDDGRPVRLTGAFQDITAHVEERQALKSANERLTLATDSGGIGIWDWNIKNNELIWDAWMYRLYGMQHSDDVQPYELWAQRVHPDDMAVAEEAVRSCVEDSKSFNSEFRILWNDGSMHYIKATGLVTRDETGRAVRMIGTNSDITQERLAEDAFRLSQEQLTLWVQRVKDYAIFMLDPTGLVASWNEGAQRIKGYASAEVIGQHFSKFYTPEDLALGTPAQELKTAITQGYSEVEGWRVRKDGSLFFANVVITPLFNKSGLLRGFGKITKDITEHKKAEMSLEQVRQDQMRFKDEFLSHVSHELRSPLTAIKQFTTILLAGLAGELNPEQRQFEEIVLKNIGQLQALIDDLFEVTRLETGKLSVNLGSVSASDTVTDAFNTVRETAHAKGIVLSQDLAPHLPSVFCDQTRLGQILIILLDNAIKFTSEAGAVTIRARILAQDPAFIVFEVSDTGCGMAPETVERIFDRLYQVEGAIQESRKGLGLGLFISKELVIRQGGKIWVESQLGIGSTFSFTLPVFSLVNVIAPLLRADRWPTGSVALIMVEPCLQNIQPTREYQELSREVRILIQSCLLPNLDILLPGSSRRVDGERFFVVAFADEVGASVLVKRIREQFERVPDLQQENILISYTMLKLCPPDVGASTANILASMAATLQETMKLQAGSEAIYE